MDLEGASQRWMVCHINTEDTSYRLGGCLTDLVGIFYTHGRCVHWKCFGRENIFGDKKPHRRTRQIKKVSGLGRQKQQLREMRAIMSYPLCTISSFDISMSTCHVHQKSLQVKETSQVGYEKCKLFIYGRRVLQT